MALDGPGRPWTALDGTPTYRLKKSLDGPGRPWTALDGPGRPWTLEVLGSRVKPKFFVCKY